MEQEKVPYDLLIKHMDGYAASVFPFEDYHSILAFTHTSRFVWKFVAVRA